MAKKRISQQKAGQMFGVWVERQSIQFVATQCTCSRDTVRRYRELHKWDDRLVKIQKKALGALDRTISQMLSENLKIVQIAKGKLEKATEDGKLTKNSTISDLDRIIRLELLLCGMADSRVDVEERSEFKHMSTEKLLELQERISKESFGRMSIDELRESLRLKKLELKKFSSEI